MSLFIRALTWAGLRGKPTTLAQSGITDAAPLASPALTGTPTAPTAPVGTNTTQLATTAHVRAQIANDARPAGWVPSFAEVTSKPSTLAGYGITDGKPASWVPSFGDVTGKPTTRDGYGITDVPTVNGAGASGAWPIQAAGLHGQADGETLRYRGYLPVEQFDGGLANGTYAAPMPNETDSILAFTTPTSTGTVQMRFKYGGRVLVRNKVDGVVWGGWREFVTDSNFAYFANANNYLTRNPTYGDGPGNDSNDYTGVGRLLRWMNYGNGHVIFDASKGVAPNGAGCGRVDPVVPWQSTYPTLMGWNGNLTFGVRVDSARYAENVDWAGVAGRPTDLAAFTNGPGYWNASKLRVGSGAPSGGVDGDVYIEI